MKWIGLTGGLASGKSTVARLLRTKGYPVIDADELAKSAVAPGSPGLQSVLREFGSDLLRPDGSLDRRELGRRVFGKPDQLAKLEALIHPAVQAETAARRKAFASQGFRLAFYDVPLLYEKNLTGFDAVVVVTAPLDVQKARLRARDGLADEEIVKRLASQLSMAEKEARADHVLRNDGDLAFLERQVDDLTKVLTGDP